MAVFRLTADAIDAIKADGKDRIHYDSLLKGFGLRVTPAGTKIFVFQRRLDGKPTRVSIGNYPEMSVAKARELARKKQILMTQGIDPRKITLAEADLAPAKVLFEDTVDRWLTEHVRPKLKPLTVRDYEKIASDLKSRFADRAFDDITKDDTRKLHAEMKATPRRANYYLSVLSSILGYGDRTGVTAGIRRYRESVKERILSSPEIEQVFTSIAKLETEKRLSVFACGALRFAILTGARPSEIRAIQWRFLDHDRKRVVLPDGKANRQRILYCSSMAWTVLTAMPRFGRFAFAGESRDTAYQNLTRAWLKVRTEAKIPDVRLYDCRHSFASQAAMAGHALPMIGALLGHTIAATTQRYVHLTGDPASQAAQDVGDRIGAAIAKGAESKGATPLRKKVHKVAK